MKGIHIHLRIQEFSSGGVQGQLTEKNCFFLLLFFSVLNLFYSFTEGVQWFILGNTTIFKVPEGVQYFQGGPNANFYRNIYNL